jgi:hypothetical protein
VNIPVAADSFDVNLYYQTTSREYIEFLRDEINGDASTLSSPTPSGETQAYIIQGDPFFSQLAAWGDTIWDLWTHNMDVPGAAPFLMTSASVGAPPAPCTPPAAPTLLSATPGQNQVALEWSAVDGATGYNVYYDQAGKAQLITDAGNTTTYVDGGLQNSLEYCYKVTAYANCESGFSNVLCAIPNNQGQADVGVSKIETGRYVTTGKGKNTVTTFELTNAFNAGDGVVIRTYVVDVSTGLPVSNATADLEMTGPEPAVFAAGPTDAAGMAEVVWQTTAPNKRGQGGTTPGTYTVTTTNVTAAGYSWDGVMTSTTFTLQ